MILALGRLLEHATLQLETFEGENFCEVHAGVVSKRCHASQFTEKTFANSLKFARVFPSEVSRYMVIVATTWCRVLLPLQLAWNSFSSISYQFLKGSQSSLSLMNCESTRLPKSVQGVPREREGVVTWIQVFSTQSKVLCDHCDLVHRASLVACIHDS